MFGHFGHLGHLTPKPQQNRPFFNLSKMANPQKLGHLGHLTRRRPPVEAWMPKSSMWQEPSIGKAWMPKSSMWQEPRIGNS